MLTAKFREHNGTLLMVIAAEPNEEDWTAQMDFARALGKRMRRCIIFSDVTMSSSQRREIAELTKAAGTEVAVVVTNSGVTRMVVTGMGWFTGVHKAYHLNETEAAFDSLDVPASDLRELIRSAHEFAHQMGLGLLARTLAGHREMAVVTRSATIG